MAIYYGRNQATSYALGKRLGGGGEGEVYDIQGKSNLVAKIYFDSKFKPTAECASPRQYLKEKIETMLAQPVNPYINGVLSVAWPQDILFDQQGQFIGYTMPRVNSRYHIFAASRERERKMLYSNYTWKTSILIAYNLALAVKVIHDTNAVIGDLNPNNIMLDEKGHVTLIDTDSFNIVNNKTGRIYKCTVGVPEMLPPELQGKNLAKDTSVFSKFTDGFALSIHIFNLLMNNCHPFGCVGLNKSQSSSSNNPVVHNIVKGNCPYVSTGNGATSPNAPDIMMLPKEIRRLFDRAFSYNTRTAIQSATVSNRPSAEEWQFALGSLYNSSMKTCVLDHPNIHVYPEHYAKCPWCAIKRTSTFTRNTRNKRTQSGGSYSTISAISGGNMGTSIRRDSWPLWLVCISIGCISGLFMAQFLVSVVYKSFGFNLTIEAAYVILFIVGGITGSIIAHYGQEAYQKAYNAWPWLFLGLLAPVGTGIIVAAIMLVIFVVILIFYLIALVLAIACICGMCSGG